MSASKGSRASGSAKESEHPKGDPELERMWAARPGDVSFRDMSRDEIEAMLLRNRVGRLAFALYDRVDIQPIHYIYERGWLYGRTSEGDKIAALKHYASGGPEMDRARWLAGHAREQADLLRQNH